MDAGLRVRRAADHLLSLPGKRIRPLCVLLASRLGGREMDGDVRQVAMACELVHAATLLHDDVIDDSRERRGEPASRVLFGNSASILAGDYLLVMALRLVARAEGGVLMGDLLETMNAIVAAEALQLERRGRFVPDRAIYLQVVRGKTAALFAWGLRAGATLGGLDAQAKVALNEVGLHLGLAFQLVDDILDVDGDPGETGKTTLQDVREGKLTWPMILASEADGQVKEQLRALAENDLSDDMPERAMAVIDRMRALGAMDASRAFAQREAEAACDRLSALPPGRARDALALIVQSAVHRMG